MRILAFLVVVLGCLEAHSAPAETSREGIRWPPPFVNAQVAAPPGLAAIAPNIEALRRMTFQTEPLPRLNSLASRAFQLPKMRPPIFFLKPKTVSILTPGDEETTESSAPQMSQQIPIIFELAPEVISSEQSAGMVASTLIEKTFSNGNTESLSDKEPVESEPSSQPEAAEDSRKRRGIQSENPETNDIASGLIERESFKSIHNLKPDTKTGKKNRTQQFQLDREIILSNSTDTFRGNRSRIFFIRRPELRSPNVVSGVIGFVKSLLNYFAGLRPL